MLCDYSMFLHTVFLCLSQLRGSVEESVGSNSVVAQDGFCFLFWVLQLIFCPICFLGTALEARRNGPSMGMASAGICRACVDRDGRCALSRMCTGPTEARLIRLIIYKQAHTIIHFIISFRPWVHHLHQRSFPFSGKALEIPAHQ